MALGPKGRGLGGRMQVGPGGLPADRKWQGYLDWCDRFFWAVDADFPVDLLPP